MLRGGIFAGGHGEVVVSGGKGKLEGIGNRFGAGVEVVAPGGGEKRGGASGRIELELKGISKGKSAAVGDIVTDINTPFTIGRKDLYNRKQRRWFHSFPRHR